MIERTLYVLAVPDLEITGGFFNQVLGFEIHEMGDPGWRMFIRDGCRIMAGHCPDALSPGEIGDHSYFAYFVVDDAEDFFNGVVEHDAEIIKPLEDEPWGMREFGIRTIDGHRIMIGQELV